jgi:hypothetical protein
VLIGTYDNIPAIDDPTVFNNLITVTGTDTLIGTSVPPYTSYVTGMTLSFIPANTNTGAVTLDLDGLGAKNVFVGSSTALSSGDLVAGRIAQIQYDGTRFQLYQSSIADNAVTTAKIADANVTAAKLAAGAAVSNIGFTPVQQGGGTGQLTNKVYIGWSAGERLFLQVDTTDFGQVWPITPAALSTASGSAPSYSARVWVNFDGTGTPTIRASGNVISIADLGVGDYQINFLTAMSDLNYAVSGSAGNNEILSGDSGRLFSDFGMTSRTTTACRVCTAYVFQGVDTTVAADSPLVSVVVFR